MVDTWTKVGGNGNTEEITDNWMPELKEELIGKYVGKKENVGKNQSTIYTLEKEDGTKIGVWKSAVLEMRMKEVQVGDTVKIVYLGKQTNPKSGRVFKNFEVFIKSGNVEAEAKTVAKKKSADKQEKDGKDMPF